MYTFTREEIVKRLRDRNLRSVSRNSGIGYFTILRLMRDADYNISAAACEQLTDYLKRRGEYIYDSEPE